MVSVESGGNFARRGGYTSPWGRCGKEAFEVSGVLQHHGRHWALVQTYLVIIAVDESVDFIILSGPLSHWKHQ